MISWLWLIPIILLGAFLGVFAMALVMVAGRSDDWAEGFRAGQDARR